MPTFSRDVARDVLLPVIAQLDVLTQPRETLENAFARGRTRGLDFPYVVLCDGVEL